MKDWDQYLFRDYLEKFLKLKYEAEGWPANCREDGLTEEELDARKKAYLDEAWDLYYIRLDPNNIAFNPGLRFIAKICLNSLWGR
jgi:hypothetical protein